MDNFYSLLGCGEDASPEEIRKKYKQLALKLHPDKNPDENMEENFNVLNQAMQTLTNEKDKHIYDTTLLVKRCCDDEDNNKIITDEISIDDFDHREGESCYSYDCRCGGQFVIAENNVDQKPNNSSIIIDCNSCSLSIRLI